MILCCTQSTASGLSDSCHLRIFMTERPAMLVYVSCLPVRNRGLGLAEHPATVSDDAQYALQWVQKHISKSAATRLGSRIVARAVAQVLSPCRPSPMVERRRQSWACSTRSSLGRLRAPLQTIRLTASTTRIPRPATRAGRCGRMRRPVIFVRLSVLGPGSEPCGGKRCGGCGHLVNSTIWQVEQLSLSWLLYQQSYDLGFQSCS